jgi:hypothetical protein
MNGIFDIVCGVTLGLIISVPIAVVIILLGWQHEAQDIAWLAEERAQRD